MPDFLLRRAGADLIERLAAINRRFETVAVLGAHTPWLGGLLRASGRHRLVVEVDRAAGALRDADGPVVQADEEAIPFAPGSLDLVVSPLALQMVNDVPGVLAQIRQSLRPDGLLLAAIVGGETLKELREVMVAAELDLEGGASPRVAPFADGRDLGALLQRTGFALPVVDSDRFSVAYRHPLALMHDLRAMGATNVLAERSRKPLRRATLARACELYVERFGRADGKVLATFEIIMLTAWAPHESQQKPLPPGSARARLADALGTTERSAGEQATGRRGSSSGS